MFGDHVMYKTPESQARLYANVHEPYPHKGENREAAARMLGKDYVRPHESNPSESSAPSITPSCGR